MYIVSWSEFVWGSKIRQNIREQKSIPRTLDLNTSRFPLIFPINTAKGGFLGLNMHYLEPRLRAQLMDNLYDTATNKNYNEQTKLRISYDILNGAAKFRLFKPTLKHYLNGQVKSKLVYINPSEWDIALFLPTARFVGASRKQVYSDSRAILQGR